jgi:carbonic anhydrase
MTPDAALAALMAGNARYVAGASTALNGLQALRDKTVDKQEPFAALLSCADSRVPVEIVFDQSIGQLFVNRVAGNIATTEMIASLEYGAAVLGTKVIMVLAHQGCGAVKAAVGGGDEPGVITALYAPLHRAVADGHHDYETTAKLNAQYQAQILAASSPVLAGLIGKGDLKIVAGYYALASGQVSLL